MQNVNIKTNGRAIESCPLFPTAMGKRAIMVKGPTMSNVLPLTWPTETKCLNMIQRFLTGFPLLDPYRNVRESVINQLLIRQPDVLELWPTDAKIRSRAIETSHIIKQHMNWPNNYYLPQDPCSLLIFDNSLGGLRNYECIMELGKKFKKDMSLFKNYNDWDLVLLVRMLVNE